MCSLCGKPATFCKAKFRILNCHLKYIYISNTLNFTAAEKKKKAEKEAAAARRKAEREAAAAQRKAEREAFEEQISNELFGTDLAENR